MWPRRKRMPRGSMLHSCTIVSGVCAAEGLRVVPQWREAGKSHHHRNSSPGSERQQTRLHPEPVCGHCLRVLSPGYMLLFYILHLILTTNFSFQHAHVRIFSVEMILSRRFCRLMSGRRQISHIRALKLEVLWNPVSSAH